MTIIKKLLFSVFALVAISTMSLAQDVPAGAVVPPDDETKCVLQNEYMLREINTVHGVGTVRIVNKKAEREYDVISSGFRLLADAGAFELRSSDFSIYKFVREDGKCVYELLNEAEAIRVTMTFELVPGQHWSTKSVKVESEKRVIEEIEVERFRIDAKNVERFDRSGPSVPPYYWTGGRPVFVDANLFMGLEYPAGYNEEFDGLFLLHHYPGRNGLIQPKPAVIGVASGESGDRVGDAFSNYLDKKRYSPPRRMIMWPAVLSKYTNADGMQGLANDEDVEKKFVLARRIFEKAAVRPDCVMVESGWQDPKSLSAEDSRASGRLGLISTLAKKSLDAPICLYVNSHGIDDAADANWLDENFEMLDARSVDFSDPKALDSQVDALTELLGRYHPKGFRIDAARFTSLGASSTHHLAGEKFAREAITDNQIKMLDAIHQAAPDAYLYYSGWHSPWWLIHLESVFSGAMEYNLALAGPPSANLFDMLETWRDAVIYRNIISSDPQFPFDGLTHHEPTEYAWDAPGMSPEHGSLESFTNMLLLSLLRGSGTFEIYMDIEKMTEEQASILGVVLKWARDNDHILLNSTKFVGGNPFFGGVYGYAHITLANRGIIGLKNHGLITEDFAIVLDETIGFSNNGKKHRARISYPYEAPLGSSLEYGDTINVSIERGRLMILDIESEDNRGLPKIEYIDFVSSGSAQAQQLKRLETPIGIQGDYIISVEEGSSADLVMLAQLESYEQQQTVELKASLNGEPVKVKRIENLMGLNKPVLPYEPTDGWVVYTLPLQAGKSRVEFELNAPGGDVWGWLTTESAPADDMPVFKTGLPAKWAATTRSEVKLF